MFVTFWITFWFVCDSYYGYCGLCMSPGDSDGPPSCLSWVEEEIRAGGLGSTDGSDVVLL